MRNPMLPGIVLFYAVVALTLAVIVIVVRQSSVMGASAQSFSNACENLALITMALGIWWPRK